MRKLLILASVVALAACQSEPAAEPASEEPATEPVEVAVTVANGSPPGAYEATASDGTVVTTMINADGTYSDTAADGTLIAEGTWAVVEGKTCFSPTTEGVTPMCFTETAPAEDGSFTATPDKGEPVTVRPKAAASEAAAE